VPHEDEQLDEGKIPSNPSELGAVLDDMSAASNWPRNRLLLALPSRNFKRLLPELEHIACRRGQVLMDADSSLDHVYFPDSGVVSVVAVYADGSIIDDRQGGLHGSESRLRR
jgi:hypothetical protein